MWRSRWWRSRQRSRRNGSKNAKVVAAQSLEFQRHFLENSLAAGHIAMQPKISFPDCRYEQCRAEWRKASPCCCCVMLCLMPLQVCDCYQDNPLARFLGACNKVGTPPAAAHLLRCFSPAPHAAAGRSGIPQLQKRNARGQQVSSSCSRLAFLLTGAHRRKNLAKGRAFEQRLKEAEPLHLENMQNQQQQQQGIHTEGSGPVPR
jgi:hypothetical protein